jgi:RNA polymerase sigma-70 factor (ECF subfamily)
MNPPPKPDAWLKQYGDYLFSIAMLKTRDKTLAEDLVQETFLSALKGYDGFQHNSSEKTWLTSILKNKIIDHYRKKDVLRNTEAYLVETEHAFYDHFFSPDPTQKGHWVEKAYPKSWETAADHSIIEKEFSAILELCLSKLPSKLLPVFMARFMDEENAENICKEFNLTSSNYWVILHRAKLLMRSCLEEKWLSR